MEVSQAGQIFQSPARSRTLLGRQTMRGLSLPIETHHTRARFDREGDRPCNRVKVGYLHIGGGVLQSWITFAITALIERNQP